MKTLFASLTLRVKSVPRQPAPNKQDQRHDHAVPGAMSSRMQILRGYPLLDQSDQPVTAVHPRFLDTPPDICGDKIVSPLVTQLSWTQNLLILSR